MKTKLFCSLVIVTSALWLPGCATSPQPKTTSTTDDARAALEELRSDFNATKIRTLNQVMKLTAPEAEKF